MRQDFVDPRLASNYVAEASLRLLSLSRAEIVDLHHRTWVLSPTFSDRCSPPALVCISTLPKLGSIPQRFSSFVATELVRTQWPKSPKDTGHVVSEVGSCPLFLSSGFWVFFKRLCMS